MNKIFVALGFIALIITCTLAVREPLSLVFIIVTFIIIGFGFGKIGEKAEFNRRLSQAEKLVTLRFCAVGFLVVSLAANIGFLFWVNSLTPIFGDAYAERKQYEDLKRDLKKQETAQEEGRVIRYYDAKESVKGLLKDSSSAEFSGEKIGKGGAVCGYVNAKNSFGAYAGNSRYISTNGPSVIDDGSQEFHDSWENTCN
ncbi:hypothetical protein [Enterobacter hormaechei]|uniref:hypothetical protein n=1 Tax=Enterobacter hormaechei TaxID=158836 RepID=UPI0007350ACF|nr:hypothetical protein [Enterobacter hormaechei]KTI63449.1 hypothetical protein ASU99_16130 [Enterobacter hormaechei subsp. steigerwaltii]MBK4364328.1 hypothetical protein [Enterobacter hormaechei]MBK4594142.1 hypothetical protein [Enterobacter hormaechei]CZW33547.1 Uncharacterised protein [Enterobacter hormaechei]CZZ46949.1 Uncharacterised protein [Enterobacter hormaechei]